eukprot:7900725-Pyramimonas_sp.AAC.2
MIGGDALGPQLGMTDVKRWSSRRTQFALSTRQARLQQDSTAKAAPVSEGFSGVGEGRSNFSPEEGLPGGERRRQGLRLEGGEQHGVHLFGDEEHAEGGRQVLQVVGRRRLLHLLAERLQRHLPARLVPCAIRPRRPEGDGQRRPPVAQWPRRAVAQARSGPGA